MNRIIICHTAVYLSLISLMFVPNICDAELFNFLTRVTGDSVGDAFYYIATGSGDVNGDSYGDVLIGAPEGEDTTYVRLYFGGADFDTLYDLTFIGEGALSMIIPSFGTGSAFIGDINDSVYLVCFHSFLLILRFASINNTICCKTEFGEYRSDLD